MPTAALARPDPSARRKYGEWGWAQVGPNASMFTYERDRNRVREMFVYNGQAKAAVEVWVANVIGDTGFTPKLGQFPAWQKRLKKWFKECDPRGELDWLGIQYQVATLVRKDGACLVRFRERFDDDRTPRSGIRIQLQVLEIDHLPATLNTIAPNGNRIVAGEERDATDRVVAYWLYQWHPQDFAAAPQTPDPNPVRVPADQVLKIKEIGRPGEARPSPSLRAALPDMRDRATYVGLEMDRKTVAAERAYWIKTPGLPNDAEVLEGIVGKESWIEQADDAEDGSPTYFVSKPGSGEIGTLPPGWEIIDHKTADVGENYEAFIRVQDRGTATASGVPYPFISGDWTGINDRIYRGITLEFRRSIGFWQNAIIIAQFVAAIIERVTAWAILNDKCDDVSPEDYDEVKYPEFNAPKAGYINPVQEVNAYILARDAGFISTQDVIGELGGDPNTVAVEQAIHAKLLETLANDPRVKAAIDGIVTKTLASYVANIGTGEVAA